jgi:hypothetical protein
MDIHQTKDTESRTKSESEGMGVAERNGYIPEVWRRGNSAKTDAMAGSSGSPAKSAIS